MKDCVKKLVHQEGFVSGADFAECPTTDINKAYLVGIGVHGLGLQRHLLKLHSELRVHYAQPAAPSYFAVADRQPFICTPDEPSLTHSADPVSGYTSLSSVFDGEAGVVATDATVCGKRDQSEASMKDSVPAHMYVPMHKGGCM